MNFAAILAGGKGTRMGSTDKPKQYISLKGKPIILYTIEKFFVMDEFETIIVLCPEAWIEPTKDIIRKEFGPTDKVAVVPGGSDRNETIAQAIEYIESNYSVDSDTVICTHDSVRPFVTYRIIKENLEAMQKYDACDTVISATDTIVQSNNGKTITSIPNRSVLYQGQTPQTFKVEMLKQLQNHLTGEDRAQLTDACKIFSMNNKPIALVEGSATNIKITYSSDLLMAEALLVAGV